VFGLRGKREVTNRRSEAGQTLALVSLGLLTFLLAAGLAVDMGYLRYQKRLMQAAADGAALAAATDYDIANAGFGAATLDAQYVTQVNGFTNGVNNTTVNVNLANNPVNAVEVDIEKIYPTFFMTIAGFNQSTISATATAAIGTSGGCMYALGVNDPIGITLNAGVDAPNCGLVTNGALNGNGNINSPSVGYFGADAFAGVYTVTPYQMPLPAADPLWYLNPPPLGPLQGVQTETAVSGPLMNGVVTLNPGTYQGIVIQDLANVTFNPGLYIIDGPTGLQISQTGIASGTGGVMFYFTGGGTATFNGNGAVTLTASTSSLGGVPPGILFYQDPGDTAAADVSEGGTTGNVKLNGTLYFPQAPLTIAGSSGGTNALTVAQNITVIGSTILDADSTSVEGGSPLENVSLVE
jgi:Flp pilus assembly protein TadG